MKPIFTVDEKSLSLMTYNLSKMKEFIKNDKKMQNIQKNCNKMISLYIIETLRIDEKIRRFKRVIR